MEALYTKLYTEWLQTEPIGSTSYAFILDNELKNVYNIPTDIADKIITMLEDLYWNHEIAYEDDDDFLNSLLHKLNSYKDYYLELITAYQVQINMLDGNKTVITRQGSSSGTSSSENEGSSRNEDYNLPNKTINEGLGNLSSANKGTNANSGSSEESGEYEESITTIGAANVIDLKKKYLDIIHNYIYDWCEHCKVCFLGIYS